MSKQHIFYSKDGLELVKVYLPQAETFYLRINHASTTDFTALSKADAVKLATTILDEMRKEPRS